ncbi:DUF4190 domain-containing protein [Micromonospora yasonensis]|uniref:DUF4190 domain-containing protein n=1 Tax=Micromonospora yasonensis TaxID=1128667 RepID=UPI00223190FB|nr:DUF4190 domain-containing protein [Micromonospora yasonensis]MCW3842092.1 DUF4190 domain-containing protein [Micromonospora yasonensis]
MSQPPGEPEQPPSPYEPPSHGQPYGQPQQPHWGHQPPGGAQPPYAPQPPYGQYGPPGAPPRPRGPNTLAILSLVFAFVFAPAGIVLGHLAKRQIRQTGEEGDQLATWGLILSYVFTVLGLIACCGWIGLAWWANSDNGNYR